MPTPLEMGLAARQPPIDGLAQDGNREELARGLLLMRASSMNLVRFQLAMERRDRAVALETVDELVAIDGRLRDFLQAMPAPGGAFDGLVREVEAQRASLVREKLTLVAGKAGPRVASGQPEWSAPAEPEPEAAPAELLLEEVAPAARSYRYVWLAWAAFGVVACAVALIMWGMGMGGDGLAYLTE